MIHPFTIPGEIVPYTRVGRERWTPRATRYLASRDAVRVQARAALAGLVPMEMYASGTWKIDVTFHRHVARGDVDNLLKAILDALEGVAWADDYQVEDIAARRCGCGRGEDRAEVTLWPWVAGWWAA